MCGIAGYIGKNKLDDSIINNTSSAMHHRGPDANNFSRTKMNNGLNVFLFHSRLSILDIHPRSNQPMEYNGNLLTFNGEIYNFKEIRNYLKKKYNINFKSKSDSEVLLMGLSIEGEKIIDKLNGMWSFAFYDKSREILILSRDRIGEKPLYFYKNDNGFYFASEIGILFKLLNKFLPIDYSHIHTYLLEGYVSIFNEKKTFFEKLNELQPSEYLILNKNLDQYKTKYWSLSYKPMDMSYDEAVKDCKENFIKAVESRLISDVPICILLSGGIDSTSIVSVAKKVLGKDLPSFSVYNNAPNYSEIEMIKITAKELKLDHTEININIKDPSSDIKDMIKHYASPMGTPSNLLNWKIFETIKKSGYKVSMMGTGGDEALTGYYEHFIFDLVEKYKTKHFEESKNAFEKYILPKLINPHLKNYKDYIINPNKRDHLYPDIELFSDCLKSSTKKITTEKYYSQSILRNRMLNFLFHQGVRFNLSEIDMNSMHHSVENRAPLLDHNFLEYCYTIPNHLLIKDGYGKSILRDAMQGIVPNSVLKAKDKYSLNVPLSKIYNLRSKKFAEYLFEDNVLEDIGLFKTENIKKMLNTKVINNEIEKFLFRVINVKEFCQIYG